jgi:hypothetical protein
MAGASPAVTVQPSEGSWLVGEWSVAWTWRDTLSEVLVTVPLPPRAQRGSAWPSVTIHRRSAWISLPGHSAGERYWSADFARDVLPEQSFWTYSVTGESCGCAEAGGTWRARVGRSATRLPQRAPSGPLFARVSKIASVPLYVQNDCSGSTSRAKSALQ